MSLYSSTIPCKRCGAKEKTRKTIVGWYCIECLEYLSTPTFDTGYTTKEVEEQLKRQIEGQKKIIRRLREEKSNLQKENHRLKKDLGILEEKGFIEKPSLPPIKVGAGYRGRPICEKHGEMLRYEHAIWRCEACKTAVNLSESLKWIREEFDGIITIK